VAPRLVDRRQPLAEALPAGDVGGSAGSSGDGGGSSRRCVERQLQLLDLTAAIDAEEVPGEAPVAAAAQSHRAVRGEAAEVDRVGSDDDAAATGGGDGGGVRVEVKQVRRGLHHPRLQEGSQQLLLRLLLVQEVQGVRVLRRRGRRRRVGEREEQRRCRGDAAGEEEVAAAVASVAAVGGGDGAAVACSGRRKKPRALLG